MKIKKISSTSAFVVLLEMGEIHTSIIAKRFLNQLNLDSGKNLFAKCNKFWPHYGEVVKNRKSCILDLVNNSITEKKMEQVIILGAGYDTLSLEIYSRSKNCRIFEIDIANMDTKKNMIDSLDSSLSNHIKCITCDMSKVNTIVSTLIRHGWNKDVPSVVIFEGISYYLPREILWKIIEKFNTITRHNRVILEYLVPNKKISKQRIPIAEYLFHLIAIEADLINITKYDLEEIMMNLKEQDGILLQHHDMKKMEKNRTSQNTIFKTKQDGWIEICEFLV